MNNTRILIALATCLIFSNQVGAETVKKDTQEKNLIELAPSDFKPAFTKDTVIELNAIVSRSLEIINEYDAIIDDVKNNSIKTTTTKKNNQLALADQGVAQIDALSKRSKLALLDMKSAIKTLEESDEVYNPAILAGMLGFVQDVEKEISSQTKALMKAFLVVK